MLTEQVACPGTTYKKPLVVSAARAVGARKQTLLIQMRAATVRSLTQINVTTAVATSLMMDVLGFRNERKEFRKVLSNRLNASRSISTLCY